MQSMAVVNFDPALGLVLLGAALAIIPLGWWLIKHRQDTRAGRFHALTVIVLFLTFDLVLFGAFTRLTDSGLGCPDWPGCYGSVTPIGAQAHIDAAQTLLPTGPVTTGKAWIEMLHRKMATAIGALLTVLMGLSWYWRRDLTHSPLLPTLTFFWVCVQGAFGAWTVTLKLFPAIVTLHLLGGMLLLLLLAWQVDRTAPDRRVAAPGMRPWVIASLGLLFVQLALGAWVSTNYAVLACTEFPLCQGQWWPPMDFANGFEIWHELGKQHTGQSVDMRALTAIHMAHRCFALIVSLVLAVTAWRMLAHVTLRLWARWLLVILAVQLMTGLANVVLGWPLLAALLHTGGAAALVVVLTVLLGRTQSMENGTIAPMHLEDTRHSA